MSKYRVGVLGLGSMGRNHMRVIGEMPDLELVGVYDPALQAEPGRDIFAKSLEDLLSRNLDYCVISAPTESHLELGLALANAGVNALIEKPLAANSEAAAELCAVFKGRGLVSGVGHVERHNAASGEAKRRIQAGQLGELLQVTTSRQGPYPARIKDVGVVKDLATHDFDLVMWMTGMKYRSVSALTGRLPGHEHEDLVSVSGMLSGSLLANHLVNWLSPFKSRSLVVTGSEGAFVIDTLSSDLTFYANGTPNTQWESLAYFRGVAEGDVIRYAIAKREPLVIEHEQFVRAIQGLESTTTTLSSGLATIRVAEAVLASAAQEGGVQKIEAD